MNQKLTLAVLSLLSLPLTAQTNADARGYVYNMRLELAATSKAMSGLLATNPGFDGDKDAFGMVCANVTGHTLEIPGLPTLIAPQVILAAGPVFGAGLKWNVPFKVIPYDVHVQGGALVFGQIEASPIHTVYGASSEPKPIPPLEEMPAAKLPVDGTFEPAVDSTN